MSPTIVHDDRVRCSESKRTVDLLCLAKFLSFRARKKKISGNLREKKQREKRYPAKLIVYERVLHDRQLFLRRGIKSLSSPSRFPEKRNCTRKEKNVLRGVGKFYVAGRVCGHRRDLPTSFR